MITLTLELFYLTLAKFLVQAITNEPNEIIHETIQKFLSYATKKNDLLCIDKNSAAKNWVMHNRVTKGVAGFPVAMYFSQLMAAKRLTVHKYLGW